ncbi:MAG: outer membrane protein assembly factor BamB, partial [Candidatus Paceibacteria bacterium]
SSNMERLKVSVPFKWSPREWYRIKTRVDVAQDGSGVVRAKVWPRDDKEPEAWTIEVPDAHARTNGAAGVYGFTPQSRFTVYIDNLSVTPND